jgi:hypothetical protein
LEDFMEFDEKDPNRAPFLRKGNSVLQ